MSIYVKNISINIGADFTETFQLHDNTGKVLDLTGYTAKSSIRKHYESNTSINFTVGFPNRKKGTLKISLPSWATTKLKPGRFVYDVLITNSTGIAEIVVEGMVNARAGISTGCSFPLPTSAQRVCIAVIDENVDSQSWSGMEAKWEQFRQNWPNRIFYLLQPGGASYGNVQDVLHLPPSFLEQTDPDSADIP